MNCSKRGQLGSVSAEYVWVTLSVITLLFIPLPGESASLVDIVIDAFKHFQANTQYLLSMP